MAKMMPQIYGDVENWIDNRCERNIYYLFRDKTPSDWIVLHSYKIKKNTKKQKDREFDFIVLAPRLGFFVLEVKGGQITRKDGKWFQNGQEMKHDGPFSQAQGGMYKLKDYVDKKFLQYTWGYGVLFPDMDEFSTNSLEEVQKSVFTRKDNDNLEGFIRKLAKLFGNYWNENKHYYGNSRIPDADDVFAVVNSLRPDYDVPLCKIVHNAYQIIEKLTKEQYDTLDEIEGNPRCLICGPAGTGKTFLAIEAAAISCEKDMKTGLFCYNTQLGSWYSEQFTNNKKPLYAGKIHKMMLEHIKKCGIQVITPYGKDFFDELRIANEQGFDYPPELLGIHSFWEEKIPSAMLSALEKEKIAFDKIIIDECQDLLIPGYLKVFDKMLVDGIANGQWLMFGDYLQQSVHQINESDLVNSLNQFATGQYFKVKLTTNCRNTKNIASTIAKLTNMGGLKIREEIERLDTPDAQFHLCKNLGEQSKKLGEIMLSLLSVKSGFEQKDIIVLSTLRQRKKAELPNIGFDFNFSSIGKYKGLENKVVILIDVNNYDEKHLLYQGMSRATTMLIILESKEAEIERKQILSGKANTP